MTPVNKILLLCASSCIWLSSTAQLEVARLSVKGFTGTGFGAFLNFSTPISDADDITLEGGLYYFSAAGNSIAIAPVVGGFRHTLDGTGSGWYVEPQAGYTFGGTDIQELNALGQSVVDANGNYVNQKAAGPTAGLGFGYIFAGRPSITIGLRYSRVFVTGDPELNLFSLRIMHSISFPGRGSSAGY